MHCGQGYQPRGKKAVVHNDKARYTHQVAKAESEKEHVCLFRINRENTLSGLISLVLHFPPPLLYIHKQQIGGNGCSRCSGTITAEAGPA